MRWKQLIKPLFGILLILLLSSSILFEVATSTVLLTYDIGIEAYGVISGNASLIGAIIQGGASILLSGLLVILYFRQQQLLETDHKPLLHVIDYRFPDDEDTNSPNNSNIELKIANEGNGTAKNLRLRSELKYSAPDEFVASEEVNLARGENKLQIRPHDTNLLLSERDSDLRPNETIRDKQENWYTAHVQQMIFADGEMLAEMAGEEDSEMDSPTDRESGFSSRIPYVMAILSQTNVESVTLHLYIEYEDMMDREDEIHALGVFGIEPTETLDLQTAVEENTRTSPISIERTGSIDQFKNRIKDTISY